MRSFYKFYFALLVSFISTVLCVATSKPLLAQWVAETSSSTSDLHAFALIGDSTAYVAGSNATLLYTEDQGTTWTNVPTGASQSLNSLDYGDDYGTWICVVGAGGTIVYSTDFGYDWSAATSPVTTALNSISFTGVSGVGWAIGDGGVILRTANYGVSWTQQASGVTANLHQVNAEDDNDAEIVGDNGTYLYTHNAGQTWLQSTLQTTKAIYSLSYGDDNTGWMVGDHVILKTTDGARTWNVSTTTNTLRSVWAIDPTTAFAVGDNGTILETTDGASWNTISSATTNTLYSVEMWVADTGWTTGASGIILASFKNTAGVASAINSSGVQLTSNFPNPFTQSTAISYELPSAMHVRLAVYNALGRQVGVLTDAEQNSGLHSAIWSAGNLPNGVYFARLSTGQSTMQRTLLLQR
jgi:photosystem II stability/assembly factor-like uncharacterized protein